ncbi:MAG: M56 family metallopeptidase [Dysgonamonadaceae bacterium]|jgi:TonB family protein|nr:M56 family metallopeptidase [Dysgonamonadaceae bacterium]
MDFLVYILKVNVAVILFYGFYRLLFQQDTFFRWKRIALLVILFISVLYPFIDMTRQFVNNYHLQEGIRNGILPVYTLPEITISGQTTGQPVSFVHYLPQLILALYGTGVAVLLIRLLIQTGTIIGRVHRTQTAELYGQTVYQRPGLKAPFSFFHWIVLDPALYTGAELQEILRHEETHVREAHSIDTLLAELLCAFCWFNPFAWLLKREIRMNLEFLADRSVLASGCEAEHYQFHLLRLTYHKAAATITNNFNVSLLKKRICMMNKKQTSKLSIFKYALLIPVVGALVFFNNTLQMQAGTVESVEAIVMPEAEAPTETIVQDTVTLPPTKGKVTKVVPPSSELVFSHVETPPCFPGGEKAMMQWINENIQYPKLAHEKNIQGRVIVRFVVHSDGSVGNVELVRSVDPALDEKAIQVVKKMPNWIPGKQNGKAVSVYYTLPILFKLQKASSDAQSITSIVVTEHKPAPEDVIIEVDGKVIPSSELSTIDPQTIEKIKVDKEVKPNKIEITLKK